MTNPPRTADVLGPLDVDTFLKRYWHKSPVLIRGAVPDAPDMIDRAELMKLARDADVESRCVSRHGRRWDLERGPFAPRSFARRGKRDWTLLVQGVNLWHERADALLGRFDFIPRARLDDLMVSYAVDGGGVGPHFDSYDVFLLQGHGLRRWRISGDTPEDLLPDAPLKILKRFEPQYDWTLAPGDMLYLPPHVAHDGTAIGECMTYSIGFRAPTTRELCTEFLGYLQDRLDPPGRYADPDLQARSDSASIDDAMIDKCVELLSAIRFERSDVCDFLGRYLTEPKANVFFDPPPRALTPPKFARAAAARGVRLDPRTLMLYRDSAVYVNGDACPGAASRALKKLADARRLAPGCPLGGADVAWLHEAWRDGFLHLN